MTTASGSRPSVIKIFIGAEDERVRIKNRQARSARMVRARSARNRATPTQSIARVIRESDPNTSGIGPRNATPPHRRGGGRPSAPPPATFSGGPAPVPGGPAGEGKKEPAENQKK